MKDTCLPDLFCWSIHQPERRIDFNGFFWAHPAGGVLIDPMPLSGAQAAFVDARGGARWILLTNADHWRDATALAARFDAAIAAPAGDRDALGPHADEVATWLDGPSQLPPGLRDDLAIHWIRGGKTAAEAALYLAPLRALVFGDAVRSHVCGRLRLLPDDKVRDPGQLVRDVLALRDLNLQALLLGDGDSLWTGARGAFLDFLRELGATR